MNNLSKYAEVLEKICNEISPGKKMVQKLMYLIERKGVALDLNYSIHFFGPYSSKLDNVIHSLEGSEILDIDTSRMKHVISMGEKKVVNNNLEKEEIEKVKFVLDNFCCMSALELEAITTLDYVATTLLKNIATNDEIIEDVKKIKGTKFKDDYLDEKLNVLKEFGFLN